MKTEIKVTGLNEFNKTMDEYLKWNKRQPAEIINAKLYFVALQAMRYTRVTSKSQIEQNLNKKSDKYPDRTLAQVLTAMYLRNKNKVVKSATSFASAVDRYIRREQSHTGFLRSGWLPAIKKLDFWNKRGDISFTKRFAPKQPTGVKQYGKDKGNVIPARLDMSRVRGTIFNYIGQDKQATPTVTPILQEGLDIAVRLETQSMKSYIEKKYNEYHAKLENKNRYKS